jgi:hypothetical protein
MSNELSISGAQFLVPANLAEAMKVAELLSKSDLVPKDYKGKPANVVVAIGWGAEVGLKPLQALQNIAVINGRGSVWGDAALALCMASASFVDCVEVIDGAGDARVARCTVTRKGREPLSRTFSVAQAKAAQLWGQNTWAKYPERMLQMRARGFALRDCFPDALRGLYLSEELVDMPAEREINPAPTTAPDPTPEPVQLIDVDHCLIAVESHSSVDMLQADWKKWAARCEAEKNLDAYKTIKAAVAAQVETIKAANKALEKENEQAQDA